MSLVARHRRFTVDEYYRMAEAGIFGEDDRVELVDGEIVEITPIGTRHAACVDRLTRLFATAVGDRAIVRVQNPVRLSPYAEPHPDLAIVKSRGDFYASGHPGPADVLLVVEVADASLDYDRGPKAAAYASAGVAELWIVDLEAEAILVRREPAEGGYRREARCGRGEKLEVAALAGVTIAVNEAL